MSSSGEIVAAADEITVEVITAAHSPDTTAVNPTLSASNKAFIFLSCILVCIGNCGGPLIMRLYFLQGGKCIWLTSALETAGWPFSVMILLVLYFRRRHLAGINNTNEPTTMIYMGPQLFVAVAFIGILTGIDNYLFAYGIFRLPVSTTAIIVASQLDFSALFSYLLVKQKFTPYTINAVVLLLVSEAVLALHTSGDRSASEGKKEYLVA